MATLDQLTELLGASSHGGQQEIRRVSAIETAQPDCMVFATDRSTYEAALRSCAGAILISRAVLESRGEEPDLDSRLLVVPEARFAFARAARFLESGGRSPVAGPAEVHPTAVLARNVEVGPDTVIGPHVVLGESVTIGAGCRLFANCTIYSGTRLGDRV